MADNNFRSYRGRDAGARERASADRDDPLAELARLIGQSEPASDYDRDTRGGPSFDQPAGDLDWAAEDRYAQQNEPAEADYDAPEEEPTRRRSTRTYSRPFVLAHPPMTMPTSRRQAAHFRLRRAVSMAPAIMPCRSALVFPTSESRCSPLAVSRPAFCRSCPTTGTTTSARAGRGRPSLRSGGLRGGSPAGAAAAVSSSLPPFSAWRCSVPPARSPIAPCSAVRCCRHCRRSSRRTTGRTRSCRTSRNRTHPIKPMQAPRRARSSSRARSNRSTCRRRRTRRRA